MFGQQGELNGIKEEKNTVNLSALPGGRTLSRLVNSQPCSLIDILPHPTRTYDQTSLLGNLCPDCYRKRSGWGRKQIHEKKKEKNQGGKST